MSRALSLSNSCPWAGARRSTCCNGTESDQILRWQNLWPASWWTNQCIYIKVVRYSVSTLKDHGTPWCLLLTLCLKSVIRRWVRGKAHRSARVEASEGGDMESPTRLQQRSSGRCWSKLHVYCVSGSRAFAVRKCPGCPAGCGRRSHTTVSPWLCHWPSHLA